MANNFLSCADVAKMYLTISEVGWVGRLLKLLGSLILLLLGTGLCLCLGNSCCFCLRFCRRELLRLRLLLLPGPTAWPIRALPGRLPGCLPALLLPTLLPASGTRRCHIERPTVPTWRWGWSVRPEEASTRRCLFRRLHVSASGV